MRLVYIGQMVGKYYITFYSHNYFFSVLITVVKSFVVNAHCLTDIVSQMYLCKYL
jgi:hypothetical protein